MIIDEDKTFVEISRGNLEPPFRCSISFYRGMYEMGIEEV